MSVGAHENPFSVRLVIGLVTAGLAAFAALVLLLAYGDRIGPIHDSRAPALSVAGTGFKGLVTLTSHFRETREIGGQQDLETDDLVVLALDARNRPEDVQRLLDLRSGRATLIILPKWATRPDPDHRAWVRTLGPGEGGIGALLIGGKASIRVSQEATPRDRFAAGRDFLSGVQVPVPGFAQTIS